MWCVQDYGVTISFYRAPYLVEIDVSQGKRILRLEEVDGNGDAWRSADVLSFNSGHWWSHEGSLQGYASMLLPLPFESFLKYSFWAKVQICSMCFWV